MDNFPIEVIVPLVVVFGYFGIYALWCNEIESRNARKMERSAGWPQAQGVVKQTIVKAMSVRVTYEYVAQGHVYADTYKIAFPQAMVVRWSSQVKALGDKVKKEVADFPQGQHVIVRYNPQDPAESVFYCRGELPAGEATGKQAGPPHFSLVS